MPESDGSSPQNQPKAPKPSDQPPDKAIARAEPEPVEVPADVIESLRNRGLDPDDPNVRQVISVTMARSGPIPSAVILSEYEDLRPGTADQIIGWAERQLSHRLGLETNTTDGAERRMDRSQRNSLIVALFGVSVAAVLAYFDGWAVPSVIVIMCIGGPTAATVVSRFLPRGSE